MVKSDKPHIFLPLHCPLLPLPHTHTNGIGLQSCGPSEDAINGHNHCLRTGSFHLLLNGCYLLQVWEGREGEGGGKERERGKGEGEGGRRGKEREGREEREGEGRRGKEREGEGGRRNEE